MKLLKALKIPMFLLGLLIVTSLASSQAAAAPNDGTSVIKVRARGTSGNETIDLRLNGQIVAEWDLLANGLRDYKVTISKETKIDTLRVYFRNSKTPDHLTDAKIDYVEIDGKRYQTEDSKTYSTATWNSKTGCKPGNKRSEWLHCGNGFVQYNAAKGRLLAKKVEQQVPATPITVRARGDKGTENIELTINGEYIAGWNKIGKNFRDLTTTVSEPTTIKTIRVHYTNDGGWPKADRNAEIDYIKIGNTKYESEDRSTYSTATWTTETGCAPGNKQSQWLQCPDGYFKYDAAVGKFLHPGDSVTAYAIADVETGQAKPAAVKHSGTSLYTVKAPGSDLAKLVASAPKGSSFYFPNGKYRFSNVEPKDDMTFIGQSTSGVVINGRGKANAFYGTADGVSIAKMTFNRFDGTVTKNPQEHAPIRGTSDIWASNRGEFATNWIIEKIVSRNNVGSGLFMGDHFVVRDSEFYGNGITGLGGDDFVGGHIYENKIHSNATKSSTGVYANGAGIKFTQAGSRSHPVVVRDNNVFKNDRHGIWCDLGCDGFHVLDNDVRGHWVSGIRIELSRNALISGNTLRDNNIWTNFINHNFNAGAITVAETKDVLVEKNVVHNSKSGVTVHHAKRPNSSAEAKILSTEKYPRLNFSTENVTVKGNTFNNIKNIGTSYGTTGHFSKPQTIVFKDNKYNSSASMKFWWTSKTSMNYSQWKAAGRN